MGWLPLTVVRADLKIVTTYKAAALNSSSQWKWKGTTLVDYDISEVSQL
jgi:hypothetical protein